MTWSDQEKQQLIQLYSLCPLTELEVIFNRKQKTISMQALSLGVRKYNTYRDTKIHKYEVWLKLTAPQYRVLATNPTEAKRKALAKLALSIKRDRFFEGLVRFSHTTVKKIKQ